MGGFFGGSSGGGGGVLTPITPTFALVVINATNSRYCRAPIPSNAVQNGNGLVSLNTQCNFTATGLTSAQLRIIFNGVLGFDYSPNPTLTGSAVQLATFSMNVSTTFVWTAADVFNITANTNGIRSDGVAVGGQFNGNVIAPPNTTDAVNCDLVIQFNAGAVITSISSSSSWSYYNV